MFDGLIKTNTTLMFVRDVTTTLACRFSFSNYLHSLRCFNNMTHRAKNIAELVYNLIGHRLFMVKQQF